MDKHTVQIILIGAVLLFIVGNGIRASAYAKGDLGTESAAGFNIFLVIIGFCAFGAVVFFMTGGKVHEIGPIDRQHFGQNLFDFSH